MAQKKITDLTLRSNFDGTCNIPIDDAIQTYRSTGAQLLDFVKSSTSGASQIHNLSIVASVSSNALTIALKQADGTTNPTTGGGACEIGFRNSTSATGNYTIVLATAATSLVVSSGSTLGNASAVESFLWVYAINNDGSIELGISSSLFDEGTIQSSTAEGGAGAADSNRVLYSTTARSNKAIRVIGRLRSTQTTAGTWAAVPTEISLISPTVITEARGISARYYGSTTTIGNTATTIIHPTKAWDTHNAYNTSTGVYILPFSGKYRLTASCLGPALNWTAGSNFIGSVFVNGTEDTYLFSVYAQTTYSSNRLAGVGSATINGNAGDSITVRMLQVSSAAIDQTQSYRDFFEIERIGN